MPVGQSANASLLRLLNAQTVFEELRRGRALSRAALSGATGMAKPTVANVLHDLREVGLVQQTIGDRRRRGVTFELVPTSALVFGLDVGGHYLRGGLADLYGGVVAQADVRHAKVEDAALPGLALELRDHLLREAGAHLDQVETAVVGVPGIVNPTDGHVRRLNPARVESYPIVEALERSLGHPVVVENDINLAALGEQSAGLGAAVSDFVFLSVGTGVGAGLVLGGALHPGHLGAAGEIDMHGDPDSPAETALLAYATTAYGKSRPPATVEAIFAAADGGDERAGRVLQELARRIAVMLIPIARVVDVELVVLGGGIGTHCAGLLDEIAEQLSGRVHYPPRLAISKLRDAVLTGALARGAHERGERIVADRLAARTDSDTDTRSPRASGPR